MDDPIEALEQFKTRCDNAVAEIDGLVEAIGPWQQEMAELAPSEVEPAPRQIPR